MQSKSLFSTIALAIFGVTLSAQSVTQGTVTVNLPEGWIQDTENKQYLSLVSSEGQSHIQVYDFGALSEEMAANASTNAIEANGIDLLSITTCNYDKVKIAKRKYTLQSNTQERTNVEGETVQQWWAAYTAEVNGKQVLIYADQFFNKDSEQPNLTGTVEAVIKSLKLN